MRRPLHGGRWTVSDGSTRMEMHQAMRKEINDEFNAQSRDATWEDSNLLAGLHVALEDLWHVYQQLAISGRTPPGAYEATSLMKP